MKYNPYAYLPRFAGLNVLPDDAFHPDFHILYDGYVYIGACTASVWLVDGKPESREEAIAQTMDYAWPYTEQMPFPPEVAHYFIERGFDWLLQFDLAADTDKQNMEQS